MLDLAIKNLVKNRLKNLGNLNSFKRKFAKKHRISCPSNVELLKAYHKLLGDGRLKKNKAVEKALIKRQVRSLSGVAVVAVLTKPYACPGKCLYCPTQKGIPKSYLDNEPAVMRAVLNKFDPFRQVQSRLKALEMTGHPIDKIELIIIGGTWSHLPYKYQSYFIKRCFESADEFYHKPRLRNLSLKTAQKKNEGTIPGHASA